MVRLDWYCNAAHGHGQMWAVLPSNRFATKFASSWMVLIDNTHTPDRVGYDDHDQADDDGELLVKQSQLVVSVSLNVRLTCWPKERSNDCGTLRECLLLMRMLSTSLFKTINLEDHAKTAINMLVEWSWTTLWRYLWVYDYFGPPSKTQGVSINVQLHIICRSCEASQRYQKHAWH